MNTFLRIILSSLLVLMMAPVSAAPPPTINYQGYLTTPTGTPTNGTVQMTYCRS